MSTQGIGGVATIKQLIFALKKSYLLTFLYISHALSIWHMMDIGMYKIMEILYNQF